MAAAQGTDAATKSAYGRRRPVMGRVRKQSYRIARVLSMRPSPAHADYLHFHPGVQTSAELADLSARVNWYMPNRPIPIYVEGSNLEIRPDGAPWMASELVKNPGWAKEKPEGSAEHVYWRLGLPQIPSFLFRRNRAEVVDNQLSVISDSLGYSKLARRHAPANSAKGASSLSRLLERRAPGGTALVMGTGPSAQLVDPANVQDDVRILCNSAVRDLDLIRAIRPDVIAFYDPVFHYGPSRYAAQFRKDLLRALQECDAEVVTSYDWAHILLSHHPELASRTTILAGGPRQKWQIPAGDPAVTKQATNVLVSLLLPIAFALADNIKIAGCDGRKTSERYFWQHNRQIQYSDEMMQTVFAAHPGFFSFVDYGAFYAQHCRELEELLSFGETNGKTIEPVTPSWIPALVKRGAPQIDD
jgi:hypothetical protein